MMKYKLLRAVDGEPEVFGVYDTFSEAYGEMERDYYNYISETDEVLYSYIGAGEATVVEKDGECNWSIWEEKEYLYV